VAVVIPLKLVYTPVDATVTAIHNYQVPSTKCHDKGAALGRAVVDAPSLRSVQVHGVRRAGTREKVCCLPTRMVSTVLDCEVP